MKVALARLVAFALLALLAGCSFKLDPITNVRVESHRDGMAVQEHDLSEGRVRELSTWFSQHQSGWSRSTASYVPVFVARAKHSDGATTVINVLSNIVVVYNKSGQFSQQIEAQELKALREALGVVNDG
ncbi:hypothetical protein [Paucibacter sp. Y2R2-4]|uniref:hypothetical protein n=1 Tax=Paucibacter sp. Y2R2-4 TaxID=2893553 RepID=UPI0021E40FA4|nr:hypothetical protein [Paucibacter sp. Y2R2-4]MCV2351119.1 hypothetical protein [Paucibacter sp. Y2R2-4]